MKVENKNETMDASNSYLCLGGFILVGLLWGAYTPIPQDEVFTSERWGGGAEASLPFYAGFDLDFP